MDKETRAYLIRTLVIFLSIVLIIAFLYYFRQDEVDRFLEFTQDREAINAYLDRIGIIGPLVLIGLLAVQIFIPSLPSEPPIIASGFAYGFLNGTLMSWLTTVAATQIVFLFARAAGRPIVEKLVPAKPLEKWTKIASERGAIFFLLAFIIPPVPSDLMIYVAGLSGIGSWPFFIANLIGRLPLVILYAYLGANGLGVTTNFIIWLVIFGVIALLIWWFYFVKDKEEGQG